MAEKTQLRVYVVALFLIVVMSLSTASFASVTVIPDIPGYTPISAGYTPSVGQLQGTAPWPSGYVSGQGYNASGNLSIGGKPLTVPAKIPLASTAGSIVKNAMRMTPLGLAGTLAAGWLLDQGMEWVDDQWMTTPPLDSGNYLNGYYWRIGQPGIDRCAAADSTCGAVTAASEYLQRTLWSNPDVNSVTPVTCTVASSTATTATCTSTHKYRTNTTPGTDTVYPTRGNPAIFQPVPATQDDWDALPDPSEVVAPELPGASYMPKGAPVGTAQYTPGRYNVGQPYQAPDGSTKQTVANVTNNTNNTVTVTTYETTIINAAGEPVADPAPEPSETEMSECEKHPETAGCKELGMDEFEVPKKTVEFTYTPEASIFTASCPSPITVLGNQLSYQPACDAMVMIKPVVLGMASIMAAYILFGAFREVS